ncbi:MAG: ABC transporter permease [Oscillospiraceae bacterium]
MKKRKSLLRSDSFQTLLTSLLCIILGVAIGYVVLLIINPAGAWKSMSALLKNFFHYPAGKLRMKYFGQTLVRTAPLLMCALSILFAYKVGMFNIGAAGQYVAGACVGLYAAIAWQLPWYLCLLLAIAAGAFLGAISGALRTYCNVNVVISGIMLNWIALYLTNLILTTVKHPNSPIQSPTAANPRSSETRPEQLFAAEDDHAIRLLSSGPRFILNDQPYELKATGFNFNAAKYCGMKENRNVILTMVIAGGLAGMGAGLYYLTGIEDWETTISSVPGMGFNGIAVAFLGGLSPFGSILASFFIQHITTGGCNVDLTVYSPQISSLISSLIIFLCAFSGFLKERLQASLRKGDERRAARAKLAEEQKGGAQK